MGNAAGWISGAALAALALMAGYGFQARLAAMGSRLDALENAPGVATPAAPPPPAASSESPGAVSRIPRVVPPEVRAIETQVEELEDRSARLGIKVDRDASSVSGSPAPSGVSPVPSARGVDPRIRAAAREVAERAVVREQKEREDAEREKKLARRREMSAEVEKISSGLTAARIPRVIDTLMKQFGIPEEQRPKVEAAIAKMTPQLVAAVENSKRKVESMPPEASEGEIQAAIMGQFGMVFMGTIAAASRAIKEVIPPGQEADVPSALMQAIMSDSDEQGGAPADGSPEPGEPDSSGGDGQ